MTPAALARCLDRLLPHLDAANVAVTGGVAIGLHLGRIVGDPQRLASAEDIDLVAATIEAVLPSVTRTFLVSHFHRPQADYPKFLVQLVDPLTRLRVDLFPDSLGALARTARDRALPESLGVVQPEDLFAHKLLILAGAAPGHPVDEKHWPDAQALAALCARELPAIDPSHLVRTRFLQDIEAVCVRCQASADPDFPLAPKQQILGILGYV